MAKKKVKKMVRPQEGRMMAGVALAMAEYFDIDVTIVRLIWFLLLLPGGLPGLVPYLICWIVIPSE